MGEQLIVKLRGNSLFRFLSMILSFSYMQKSADVMSCGSDCPPQICMLVGDANSIGREGRNIGL